VRNFEFIQVDDVRPLVRRITLNRPEKRNALSNELRGELFAALESADVDPDVRVTIIRGSGKAFSAGYDLVADLGANRPYYSAGGLAEWPRHVVEGCFRIWDLAKPVVAQVHGFCLAGGTELAQACDLVYVAEDAAIGYPVVRSLSPPDNCFFPWVVGMRRAMEMMLTGASITGTQAVEYGFANRAFPLAELDDAVLAIAEEIAQIPEELSQFNKRGVHRQMELMGMRAAIRAATDSQALAARTKATQDWVAKIRSDGLTSALSERDGKFGDYREAEPRERAE
jgi:enoyl-CoA hydratase